MDPFKLLVIHAMVLMAGQAMSGLAQLNFIGCKDQIADMLFRVHDDFWVQTLCCFQAVPDVQASNHH